MAKATQWDHCNFFLLRKYVQGKTAHNLIRRSIYKSHTDNPCRLSIKEISDAENAFSRPNVRCMAAYVLRKIEITRKMHSAITKLCSDANSATPDLTNGSIINVSTEGWRELCTVTAG